MDQAKNVIRPSVSLAHYSTHYLFDTSISKVLGGLDLASSNTLWEDIVVENEMRSNVEEPEPVVSDTEARLMVSEAKICNACQIQFDDREEQILHYKTDWHRYNLHCRLKGVPPLTEDQFEAMSGDVSSISGSDDEEEEDNQCEDVNNMENLSISSKKEFCASFTRQRESHKVFFKNKEGDLISVHRCLLHHKKNPIYEKDLLISAATNLPSKSKWAVLMVTCGHFAGGIFTKNEILEHKTFHRYTVRKKRGTAQSSHDSKGRQASSAGANLRRYNEAALVQEVQELLSRWQDKLDSCHFVFVRIPAVSRGMFFGGKNAPFKKDDPRIRVLPFPTRRPTFSELKRVQQILASVECYGKEADIGPILPRSPRRYFDKESGQLKARLSDREQQLCKTKTHPIMSKSRDKTSREVHSQASPDSSSNFPTHELNTAKVYVEGNDEEVNLGLFETTKEIHLAEEFECSPKRKLNREKEKETKSKIMDFSVGERHIRWKNSLFTASKTGNKNIFKTIVEEMAKNYKEVDDSATNKSTGSCKSDSGYLAEELLPPQQQMFSMDSIAAEGCSFTCPNAWYEHVAEFLNRPLGDGGQTLLHVASRENQADMVHLLLDHGANPAVKDRLGKMPYNHAGAESRNMFRRFMSLWPDRYDYSTAQIPSPLTEEMEAERKRKAAEKRKAKKKAANERNKEKKEALEKLREEEQEKERFLALSDREKRALAAERRILQQHDADSSVKPVLSWCWECAVDITGKVPLEYSYYKFCSTKCLREHRLKTKGKA